MAILPNAVRIPFLGHSLLHRADDPLPLPHRTRRTDQRAQAAAMADLLKQFWLVFYINQRIKPAGLHTFPAADAFFPVILRHPYTDGAARDPAGMQKQSAVGLLHIAVAVDGTGPRGGEIGRHHGLSGDALPAQNCYFHWIP